LVPTPENMALIGLLSTDHMHGPALPSLSRG
jgi:hypothetical protein